MTLEDTAQMLHAEDGGEVQNVAQTYKALLLQWVSPSEVKDKASMSRDRPQGRGPEVATFPCCAGKKRTNAKRSSEGSPVAL